MYATVKVSGIWAEDLFQWFHDHICTSGGDGAGMIVCENYKEVSEWFEDWYYEGHNRRFTELGFRRFETEDTVSFDDGNENWIFSKTPHSMHSGDYTFIVVGRVVFAMDKTDENDVSPRTVLPGVL